ncbi:MAG: cellulase family glycosylhydrolase [Chloroflexota bacterium]|nr:MAG: hypothetical protein DIU68_04700 [Chloroflexota bacterium]
MTRPAHMLFAGALLVALLAVAPSGQRVEAQATPLDTCSLPEVQAAFAATPAYQPTSMPGWVEVENNYFVIDGTVFTPQGVNYYPSRSPWRRFLTETNIVQMEQELDMIASAGFNTLRIYLWNDALFQCPGSGAVPNPPAFQILDAVLQRAAVRGMRVIVTLNDMPDLETYPLYSNPQHVQAQTRYIVSRYANEPAIMAWDLRNAGDIDYGIENDMQGQFTRGQVLNWLASTAALVRSIDSRHLITAGWAFDSAATAPHVDFISFAHWSKDTDELRGRLLSLAAATRKPIVLTAFGYSTFELSEEEQRDLIQRAINVVEDYDAAGYVLWTAFDFPLDATCTPPACPSEDSREHHFGLWRWDFSPKPALEIIAAG